MSEPIRRTAIVTGTSSGLGSCVAERLASLGWDVLGTVRGDGAGLPFETVRCDVTDDDAVSSLGHRVMERWGRLDALVNNAGVSLTGPVEELAPMELRRHLDVNLVAPLALVRACLPALRAAQGVVVQVGSVSGYSASELFAAYNASKFGLEGASEALAAEVAGQRVVSCSSNRAPSGPRSVRREPTPPRGVDRALRDLLARNRRMAGLARNLKSERGPVHRCHRRSRHASRCTVQDPCRRGHRRGTTPQGRRDDHAGRRCRGVP